MEILIYLGVSYALEILTRSILASTENSNIKSHEVKTFLDLISLLIHFLQNFVKRNIEAVGRHDDLVSTHLRIIYRESKHYTVDCIEGKKIILKAGKSLCLRQNCTHFCTKIRPCFLQISPVRRKLKQSLRFCVAYFSTVQIA